MTQTARRIIASALFLLLAAGITVPFVIWHRVIWQVFSSREGLRDWVHEFGPRAPLVYVAAQAFQIVAFAIPGEPVQIAGGMLFGSVEGSMLAVAGTVLGASVGFVLARLLGRPFVASFVSPERMKGIEVLLSSRRARSIIFLLFLIPGIPKDVLCYVCGVSPISFSFFIAASTLARLPALVGSAIIGDAAAANKWALVVTMSAAALVLFAAGLVLRPRIQSWIEKRSTKP
ncbi:MAG: TVP38/TMEM64 family protein [Spirochaetia bacterium]